MGLTRAELRRIRPAGAAVAGWVGWGISLHAVASRPHVHPAWFVWLVMGVEAVALTWCVHDVLRRPRRAFGPTVLVVASVMFLATAPYATNASDPAMPPLLHVILVGTVLAPTALSAHGSVTVGAVLVVSLTLLRRPVLGTVVALVESLQMFVVLVLQLVLWTMLKRALATTHRASLLRWRAEKEAARARQQATERERWDALLHDKVLGALQFAVRGRAGPAASLAKEALDTLTQESPRAAGAADLRSLVESWSQRLELQVALDVDGGHLQLEPEVWEVVRGVVTEALVNVARHSGQSIAWVEGHLSPDSVHLVVGDPGRGFDPAAPSGRSGLRLSTARVASVGGELTVSSRPGRGTRVEIAWQRLVPEEPEPEPWGPDIVRVMFLLGSAVVGLCAVAGLTRPDYWRSGVVAWSGVCVIALMTAWAVVGPLARRTLLVCSAGFLLSAGMLAANMAPPYVADWRWWFVGTLTTAVSIVVLRFGVTLGVLLSFALIAVIVGGYALGGGGAALSALVPVVPQLPMSAAVAGIVRRGLERSLRSIRTAQAEAGRAEIVAAAADARTEVFARRAVRIRDAAGQPLELIARRHVPTESERHAWARLEGSLRDQLVAGALLTPSVIASIEAARDRGVDVDVVNHGEIDEQDVAAFGAFCSAFLASAGPHARVTVMWRPFADGRFATLVVEGPHAPVQWPSLEPYSVESLVHVDASLYTLRRQGVLSEGDADERRVLEGRRVT